MLHPAFIANWGGRYWDVTETREEESVYPVCMTRSSCQNLPSPPVPHTDCVFRVQSHRHQTLKREQRKTHITDLTNSALLHYSQQNNLSYLHCSMVGHKEKANHGYRAEENSCPAPGTSSKHVWMLLLEEPPIADGRQQRQWSRRDKSSSHGNPSLFCRALALHEEGCPVWTTAKSMFDYG